MELDLKAVETAIASGLPVQVRWMVNGTPLDFDFSVAHQGLRGLHPRAIEADDGGAFDLVVFGEQEFAEGGGSRPWLCVRQRDGSVQGFDSEREQPMFLLNSSIDRFVATFRFLHKYLMFA